MFLNVKTFVNKGELSKLTGCIWGGSHVARLNFKASRVGVYKCFTSLSEIGENSLSLSEF